MWLRWDQRIDASVSRRGDPISFSHLLFWLRQLLAALRRSLAKRFSSLFHLLGFLRYVRQSNGLEAAALGHNAIVESYIGAAAAQLMDLKSLRSLAADIEAFAVAVRSKEYMVLHAARLGLSARGSSGVCKAA